jgi:hypothetical protein
LTFVCAWLWLVTGRRIAYPACQDSESDAAVKMSTLPWNRKGFAAPGARAAFPSKPTFVSGMIALTHLAKTAENFPGEGAWGP